MGHWRDGFIQPRILAGWARFYLRSALPTESLSPRGLVVSIDEAMTSHGSFASTHSQAVDLQTGIRLPSHFIQCLCCYTLLLNCLQTSRILSAVAARNPLFRVLGTVELQRCVSCHLHVLLLANYERTGMSQIRASWLCLPTVRAARTLLSPSLCAFLTAYLTGSLNDCRLIL